MRLKITVTAGPARGQHFIFDQPDCFLFGRAEDAHVSLPDDLRISRQHFLIEISPPECKLTDLNSKNGVLVNGLRYGGRKPPKKGIKQAPGGVREVRLKNGDEIAVGRTRMKISIQTDMAGEVGAGRENQLPDESAEKRLNIEGYRLEQEISRSNKEIIYKATEIQTGKPVTIRTFYLQLANDSQKVKRFQHELEVLCRLNHQHIVRILGYGQTQESFHVISEFIDGISLDTFLQSRGGQVSLEEAASIMLGTLDGLTYAHRVKIAAQFPGGTRKIYKGIVHRDLNPHNILLSRQGDFWLPKITGFGLSRGLEVAGFTNITIPEEIPGFPMYWPREQITHYKSPVLTIDVFSIAAIFYEMLTGTWIRDGFTELLEKCKHQGRHPSIADYLNVIVTHPIIPIYDRNPDIPNVLAEVINRALREQEIPHDRVKMREHLKKLRYPDAGAFRNALVDAFKTLGIPLSASFKVQQQDQALLQKGLPGAKEELERPEAGTVMYSVIQPTLQKEVALFVLDLERSTQYVLNAGDTSFSQLIGSIHRRVKAHVSSSDLIFLKCTGDGFLMVFTAISAAFALASTFLEMPIRSNLHIRMALHWGTVKIGPEGDVLGAEVHRVYRVEGVKVEDQIDPMADTPPLPASDRILITRQGLEQLSDSDQQKFRPAGKFQLKGFNKPCELWVYSYDR